MLRVSDQEQRSIASCLKHLQAKPDLAFGGLLLTWKHAKARSGKSGHPEGWDSVIF
jgi:hypothetical protein